MSHPQQDRGKPVVLKTYDNEPTAFLAEQRLRQEGIPCLVRSLHGGPGLWGSAYNLPHALYVFPSDLPLAREILGIPPLEIAEREPGQQPGNRTPKSGLTTRGIWLIIVVVGLALGSIIFSGTLV